MVRADTPGPVEAVFSRVLVHAATPLVGDGAFDYARQLAACFGGEVVDGRLSHYGDSLVRFCTIPILFVPETYQGASS